MESTSIKGNVHEYLNSLPKPTLDKLYAQPATCLAVLRLLPNFAQHIIMRLVYTFVEKITARDLEAWCLSTHLTDLHDSIKKLLKLNILVAVGPQDPLHGVFSMNRGFQESLRNALVGGGNHTSFGEVAGSDKHNVDVKFLDEYASQAWEAVLHYMVGTPSEQRSGAVQTLLEKSGLMARSEKRDSDELRITNKGFQFLLQDVNVQVWAFLLQYLDMADELNLDLVDELNFLFQLGSLELGQGYSVERLTVTQRHMLDDLKHFGIVYQRKKKSTRFYPTKLATSLTSGWSRVGKAEEKGFIIVETNFRIYAYTDSPLQIAVLSLFVEPKSRFVNMIVGALTRDSVRGAMENGITADQIIMYLTTHAHPEMRKTATVLPPTVVDQIRLWELERNRMSVQRGCLYKDFSREADYRSVLNFAKQSNYLLWQDDQHMVMVIAAEGHEAVKSYVRQRQVSRSAN
ncbi:transcription factor Tfb2-domain-containing protein [Polychytrium aggregatum]|uniref:transcription factor Tfb2-domain-containing protein n=1 Tax=Polychytrium aggregatum TaxID=110093 RepID=UPI0022FE9764|nr:transcription factor Tfb2-domain-containing protein [Polychytrium aggregatum]KAI9202581.1 transcription factor Tfb2-domain-containing protein [Polychytrium aggregatum]